MTKDERLLLLAVNDFIQQMMSYGTGKPISYAELRPIAERARKAAEPIILDLAFGKAAE